MNYVADAGEPASKNINNELGRVSYIDFDLAPCNTFRLQEGRNPAKSGYRRPETTGIQKITRIAVSNVVLFI